MPDLGRDPQRPLVVIGAGSFWDGTRLADRHIAERLVERADVLYVDPPMSYRSARNDPRLARSAAEPPLRVLRPGLWRLTVRVPPRNRYALIRPIASHLMARALRGSVQELGGSVTAVLSTSDQLLGVVGGKQIMWARDDYAAGADLMGVSAAELAKRETRSAQRADFVVAVTPTLVEKWQQLGVPAHLVPNGVDVDLFSAAYPRPLDMPELDPVVGFSGTLSARIDLDILHGILDDGMNIVMLGWPQRTMRRSEMDALLGREGLHWLGNREYEKVPSYVQAFDVGLVPYTHSSFNRASFPLKTLEYLAAGVPVVATDLPAIEYLGTDLVEVADAEDFASAVRRQCGLRHDPQLVTRRREFALQHSWDHRVAALADLMEL